MKSRLNYKKGDYNGMNTYFTGINWEDLFAGKEISVCYSIFIGKYNEACDKCIPRIKSTNKRIRPSWLSKELKSMMREKQSKWCRFVGGGRKDLMLLEEHREQCKIVKQKMNKCISDYEISLATSYAKNPKALYGYMKSKHRISERIGALNRQDGTNTTDRKEITEILNAQFESVFSVDEEDEQEFESRTESICNGEGIIHRKDIKDRLQNLNCDKTAGGDGVTQRVLSSCSDEMAKVLEIIFKKAMEDGEKPEEWGRQTYAHFLKKGVKWKQQTIGQSH